MMIKEAIIKLVNKQDLSFSEAGEVMDEIIRGKTTPTQNAAFLAALATKNTRSETEDEIAGCAASMFRNSRPVDHPYRALDLTTTGGGRNGIFDFFTVSSFVTAAAGSKTAKHGGTADIGCLDALGIVPAPTPDRAAELLDETGVCFLSDSDYHPRMDAVEPLLKELGFRTVFDILCPLINPARPVYEVLGIYDERLLMPMAHVLTKIGIRRGLVLYGQDGIGGFTCAVPTTVCDFENDDYDVFTITPEEVGLPRCRTSDLVSGSPEEDARITLDILNGRRSARYDTVLLNSASGLLAGGKVGSLKDGIELAEKMIGDGKALKIFEKVRDLSKQ